jgi:sarcosine oxidase subunit beta
MRGDGQAVSRFHHSAADCADVVIIGAGIVGASIAWHLAEAGVHHVILLERDSAQGRGSTGKSMGGVRAQFATDVNIQMSRHSIPFFASFRERLGFDIGYRPHGYLFCATGGTHLAYLRANQQRQHALGLTEARAVSTADIERMVPGLRTDDIVGGAFCPTDGFVDPYSVMTAFTQAACARGAKLVRSAEVTAIGKDEVVTTAGTFAAGSIVIAAGAWSGPVAALAGRDLPVTPLRRMLAPTEPFPGFEGCPMVIDMSTGFHFRPEGRGLLLAWSDPGQRPGFDVTVDPSFLEKILTRAADRVPAFEDLPVNPRSVWAGLYEMTPDHHAILGPDPEQPRLFYATGFSGHGVMHSPATGRILADLITTGSTSLIDWKTLDVNRFQEGRAIAEGLVL